MIAAELHTPLTVEPFVPDDIEPIIEGVIVGSPAAACEIQRGDAIRAVNGRAVRSRVEAFQLLSQGTAPATIGIERTGQRLSVTMSRLRHQRPGIVMYHDIDYGLIDRIQSIIHAKQADRVLILTSNWLIRYGGRSGNTTRML